MASRTIAARIAAAAAIMLAAAPAAAQVRTVDPNDAIDRDLAPTARDPQAPAPVPDPYASPSTGELQSKTTT